MANTDQSHKHEASIKQLEKIIAVVTRRLAKLEQDNQRLRRELARTNLNVSTLQHTINKG